MAQASKDLRKGSEVWYFHQGESAWLKGTVLGESGGSYNLLLQNGERLEGQTEVYPANPSFQDDMNDLMQLTHLNDPCLLFNLKSRFEKKVIYTVAGTVLIAVNPFERLDIYGKVHMNRYRGAAKSSMLSHTQSIGRAGAARQPSELDPHIYGVAADAFRRMERDNRSQSVVISGESGSGKTESTKHALNYLASLSKPVMPAISAASGKLPSMRLPSIKAGSMALAMNVGYEQKVLETNPILEAFGNAKTVRNDNSSRFGKLIQIHFTHQLNIVGASIRTYLLEKSRVVAPSKDERSYHIFYQLLAGSAVDDPAAHWWWDKAAHGGQTVQQALHLVDDCSHYEYLANSETEINGVDDAAEYVEMCKAFEAVGFSAEEVQSIMSLTAAVLWMGNIKFKDGDSNDPAELVADAALQHTSQLLGVEVGVLSAALTKEKKKAGRDIIEAELQLATARSRRDSLAKAVYSGMFDWIVAKLNTSLNPGRRAKGTSIGILDIFGFEVFKHNSFEQLCINYANEKLQAQFCRHEIKQRQQEYVAELGSSFPTIPEPENVRINSYIIQLLEGGPIQKLGLFALLDEEATLGRSGKRKGEDFVQAVKQSMKDVLSKPDTKDLIKFPPRQRENFEVCHAADRVMYESDEMNMKNQDALSNDVIDLLAGSKHEALAVLGSALKVEASNKKGPATVGKRFRAQMQELEQTLDATDLHFVRCIKPTDRPTPPNVEFNQAKVMDQLKCAGISTVASIAKAGFPTRYELSQFASLYSANNLSSTVGSTALVLFSGEKRWFTTPKPSVEDVKALLAAHGVGANDYQIGKTKIFFRAGALGKLDDSFAAYKRLMVRVVAMLRCFLMRTHWIRVNRRATHIQRAWRSKAVCRAAREELVKLRAEAAEKRRLEELAQKQAEDERRRKLEEERMLAEAAKQSEEEKRLMQERLERERKEREERDAREKKEAAARAATAGAAAVAAGATTKSAVAKVEQSENTDARINRVATVVRVQIFGHDQMANGGTPRTGGVTEVEPVDPNSGMYGSGGSTVLSPFQHSATRQQLHVAAEPLERATTFNPQPIEREPSFTLGETLGQDHVDIAQLLLETLEDEELPGHRPLADAAYEFVSSARAIGEQLTTLKSVQYALIRVPHHFDFNGRHADLMGTLAQFKHNFRQSMERIEMLLEPDRYLESRTGFFGVNKAKVETERQQLEDQATLLKTQFYDWLTAVEGSVERVQAPSFALPGQSTRYTASSTRTNASKYSSTSTAPTTITEDEDSRPSSSKQKRSKTSLMGWLGGTMGRGRV